MAAVFATAIITIIPGVNFSGLIVPFSSLKPMGQIAGSVFPGAWYQEISAGSFVKGFGWDDIRFNILVLAGFAVAYLVASALTLRKQER